MDLARQFLAENIPVCIGGFHVSGCVAMLPDLTPEIKEALQCGVTLFIGEAEDGRLAQLLQDAYRGTLSPMYEATGELPSLEGAPSPILPARKIWRTASGYTSFDGGRGCPFQCSFCTIINVQGRKSRYRSADDVERIVRANLAQRIRHFFVTDDNFARNKNWEKILDRLIQLREIEGLDIRLVLQVDTLCHKIPNFIEKAARAGVTRVFIGLESINPETLAHAKKRQNRITEYRRMVQAWRDVGTLTYAGYILGFPTDTPETILRDIEIIKRELPIDLLEFFCLTPLPGSEDHKNMYLRGTWMDPDLNKYDSSHATTDHPHMSREEWKELYRLAWKTYYSPQHVETILKRARRCGIERPTVLRYMILWFYGSALLEGIHPLEGGVLRLKFRRDRRPGLPIEPALAFYRKYLTDLVRKHAAAAKVWWCHRQIARRITADPVGQTYTDLSLTPVTSGEFDELDMFTASDAAKAAVIRARPYRGF
jgi:Radical SAM superfamily